MVVVVVGGVGVSPPNRVVKENALYFVSGQIVTLNVAPAVGKKSPNINK